MKEINKMKEEKIIMTTCSCCKRLYDKEETCLNPKECYDCIRNLCENCGHYSCESCGEVILEEDGEVMVYVDLEEDWQIVKCVRCMNKEYPLWRTVAKKGGINGDTSFKFETSDYNEKY